MRTADESGPAFPMDSWNEAGMTLRDYFAAKAMASILTKLDIGIGPIDCIRLAEDAYFVSDAMLKARFA